MSEDSLRSRIGHVIFETNTRSSHAFDIALLWAILLSVAAVILESVASFRVYYGDLLRAAEWFFTILFTIEYALRIYSAPDRRKYIFSFFGIVDLLAILPSYLSLVVGGAQYVLVIRSLRLLRVFRILKLVHFLDDADLLLRALRASREKILVFLFAVCTLVLIAGTLMFLVEGPVSGFNNIPTGIYWAVVTLTTVGYGDIVPASAFGKFVSSVLMVTGYAVIAVPTGIVTTELGYARRYRIDPAVACPRCNVKGHSEMANYCFNCGERLELPTYEESEEA